LVRCAKQVTKLFVGEFLVLVCEVTVLRAGWCGVTPIGESALDIMRSLFSKKFFMT
jgi:hypothetical protein